MLPARAVYTIPELARLAGISRWRLRRLLDQGGVELHRSGRLVLVYLSALHQVMPDLWDSLVDRERAAARAPQTRSL